MKFRATLDLNGKTATGIRVPKATVEALGKGRRVPVRVTINGYTCRSTVAVYNGEYLLPVSAEVRAGAGIQAGDKLQVDLEVDTEKREVVVPSDFKKALAADPVAKATFAGLSYSNKRRYVLSIEGAKQAKTRQRRIDKSVAALHEG
ncbi:MAG: YdeI/OmpD-associated family protein [Actinomycetota bacterium]